jgi:hypothetical protein
MRFDRPTHEELRDPGRMWLDQLSGRRNFDHSAFMGFINDLLERDDWPSLFADLPNGAGFVAKLGEFFERHRGGLIGENCRHLYFYPLQRNALDNDRLVALAQRHVTELARIASVAGEQELHERLSSATVVWSDADRDRTPMPSGGLNDDVYCIIGDFLEDHRIDPEPQWFSCLREACYTIAADYDLQRYLMSDFYSVHFDYHAYYEFWIGGGQLSFEDDGRCLVGPVKHR